MKNSDLPAHVSGKSLYIDDLPCRIGTLYGVIFSSPSARGKILELNTEEALNSNGVIRILTYRDITGKNEIGHEINDQPLFAEKEVKYIGQPIALVVALNKNAGREAVKKIKVKIEEEKPVIHAREAFILEELIGQNKLECGDVDSAWNECDFVFEGHVDSGGQEHFYMETQGAVAEPMENGNIKVSCSTHAPGHFHRNISTVLGVPMNKVEVDIKRLGGAFGGKEGCSIWACCSALAAFILNKPVKIVLNRHEDITTTGKRHPYSSDFKIGLKKDGTIHSYEIKMYQDAGAFADMSMGVLNRCMLHTTGSYNIKHFRGTSYSCKTNLPPNTACRGLGVPQAFFLIESAIHYAAFKMNINPIQIQKRSLIRENDSQPCGMIMENCHAEICFNELEKKLDLPQRLKNIEEYNKNNKSTKKGLSVLPLCFAVSFVSSKQNQASSLVHIYADGTVSVSTGAVEVGQGVNSKIQLIVSKTLNVPPEMIKIESTNTSRIANASPTAASTGSDLNGMAAYNACMEIISRLKKFAANQYAVEEDAVCFTEGGVLIKGKDICKWNELINDALEHRIDLSAHGYYAPPQLHWDEKTMKGHPYTYYTFGACLTEVTLDSLRGTYVFDSVEIVHDAGSLLSEEIDRGQIEGGVIQGMGWSTIEQLVHDEKGKCLSLANTYKIPTIKFTPEKFTVSFLENMNNPYAVYNSKGIGEPPFVYGIGAYFALLNALMAADKKSKEPIYSLPMTPEKSFMYLYE